MYHLYHSCLSFISPIIVLVLANIEDTPINIIDIPNSYDASSNTGIMNIRMANIDPLEAN